MLEGFSGNVLKGPYCGAHVCVCMWLCADAQHNCFCTCVCASVLKGVTSREKLLLIFCFSICI